MSPRSLSAYRSWVLAAALVVATGGGAAVGRTQQVAGSIGVALTILEPVATPPLRVTGFDLGRDGLGRIETTLPASAQTSLLVMARVASSTTGYAPETQPPTLVAPSSGVTRVRYLVNVGRDRRAGRAREGPTELRVEYLIVVAGT